MKRNSLINLALLLLVTLLALVVVYEPGITPPVEAPRLLQLERDAVTRLRISRPGKEDVELQREQDGQWQMVQPRSLPASDYRIDSLLRITGSRSLGRFEMTQGRLAEYGLDTPAAELTLNGDIRIVFGSRTPLDHRRYVLLGETVHLINDTLYYHLIGDFPTFVSPRLLPSGESISTLSLPALQVRWQEGRWQLTPAHDSVNPDQVTQLLDSWQHATAMQVRSYDGAEGELINIRLGEAHPAMTFLLTAREPDLVLARPELGIEYHFPAEAAATMLNLPVSAPPGSEAAVDPVN